jgi:hypothetical protein
MFQKDADDASLPPALRREKELLQKTPQGGYTHKFLKKGKIGKAIRSRIAAVRGRLDVATEHNGASADSNDRCPAAKFVKKTEKLYQGVRVRQHVTLLFEFSQTKRQLSSFFLRFSCVVFFSYTCSRGVKPSVQIARVVRILQMRQSA